MRTFLYALFLASVIPASSALQPLHAHHGEGPTATAEMKTPDGKSVGTVELEEMPTGLLITARLENLPEGTHGFHLHAVGRCDGPDFKSAGGHFNPTGDKHGLLVQGGPHAGDMPNIHVPASGEVTVEILNTVAIMDENAKHPLLDEDGASVMIHSGPDDYRSQPSGAAGRRIACGVIQLDK